ncbi:MAG: hypothetical protein ACU836_11210 [Gammaproteobacteria bacterium]
MPIDIMLTIAATAIVQSIFGAGVLLFGTPILLLLGYEFIDALIILLPISLAINGMQILKDRAHIDHAFYRKIISLALPPIALFLFLVTHTSINISLLIGAFLLLIALKSMLPLAERIIDSLMKYQKSYFVLMGVVHGVSHLGGSLLTAAVHQQRYPKNVARVTVAVSYATFAAVQLATLFLFSRQQVQISYYDSIFYIAIGSFVFEIADDLLFLNIDQEKYQRLFSLFLAISGLVLIGKAL